MTLRRIVEKCLMHAMAWINYPAAKILTWRADLRKDKFFCISMSGNSYGDNIKYLSEYISEHAPHAEIVWAFSPSFFPKANCPFKSVKLYTFNYYYHILTSKFILSNARLNQRMLHKRRGQIYLQTWHGTALKRLGTDVKVPKKSWLKKLLLPGVFEFDVRNTDIMISGSRFMTNLYRDKFGFKGRIEETGTPRNDIFFQEHPEIREKVCSAYGIDKDKQIILYAPTFRSDGSFKYYDVDADKLMKCWTRKTGKECVFLVRLHPNLMHKSKEIAALFPEAINVSTYPDMQELLYTADLLITDYSSSMFDFMYTYRPVLLYTPDKDTYDRGFYFELDELPFMTGNNMEELKEQMSTFSLKQYKEKVMVFSEYKLCSLEKGHANENILKELKDRCH